MAFFLFTQVRSTRSVRGNHSYNTRVRRARIATGPRERVDCSGVFWRPAMSFIYFYTRFCIPNQIYYVLLPTIIAKSTICRENLSLREPNFVIYDIS